MFELAEDYVYNFLDLLGFDTEEISDTGTVENIVERGYTLEDIHEMRVPSLVILDNIAWL